MNIINLPERTDWPDLIRRPEEDAGLIEKRVDAILKDVRKRGDAALYDYAEKFDGVRLDTLQVDPSETERAFEDADHSLVKAMELAAENIARFHEQQNMSTPVLDTSPGVRCWQRSMPIEKVGIYVPGGTAPLLSSLLMLAIPAQLAECETIVVCSPPDGSGNIHPSILAPAHIAGIRIIFKAGGAQAVAAMGYGTETIPQVYKIFGPGNRYVTMAKQKISLSGVAIDMPAGPSEVAVIADEQADPESVAWDLLSQAEHGPDSQVLLVTDSKELAGAVEGQVTKLLRELPRKEMARISLDSSHIIIMPDLSEAIEFVNEYAPEHLIINTADADELANRVRNAGSVFIGPYTPESAGDYASGTNHTLPTNAAARAYSGVTLESFRKIITFQHLTAEGLRHIGPAIERLAQEEGLEAHRQAVAVRLRKG